MNTYDQKNLEFLLSADNTTLDQWYQTVSQDDVEYALELLQMHRSEIELRDLEITDSEAEEDLSQARAVLARFTLH